MEELSEEEKNNRSFEYLNANLSDSIYQHVIFEAQTIGTPEPSKS